MNKVMNSLRIVFVLLLFISSLEANESMIASQELKQCINEELKKRSIKEQKRIHNEATKTKELEKYFQNPYKYDGELIVLYGSAFLMCSEATAAGDTSDVNYEEPLIFE